MALLLLQALITEHCWEGGMDCGTSTVRSAWVVVLAPHQVLPQQDLGIFLLGAGGAGLAYAFPEVHPRGCHSGSANWHLGYVRKTF